MCRRCGQAWHRECLTKAPTCPACRSAEGYVKPRPYDELIHMIVKDKVRCDYCHLTIKSNKPRSHLSKCEKYKNHLLEQYLRERKVLGIALEKSIPQDPFELNPREHLKSKFLVGIPDLRSENREIQLLLKLRKRDETNAYVLSIRPTSDKYMPLTLNLLVSDSIKTLPQFLTLSSLKEVLTMPVEIKSEGSVRVWLNCL